MATSLNIRLDDEREEKLKELVEDLRIKKQLGAEINNSTVIRGALDKFIEENENEKKGIKRINVSLNSLTEKELNYLVAKVLPDLYEYQDNIVPKELLEQAGAFKDTEFTEIPMLKLQELLFNVISQLKFQVLSEMTERLKI